MLAYMAPMDEITTFVFRNAYHRYYAPMDKYFTPFLSPADFGPIFDPKEMTEIDPANNQGLTVIPQLMVNRSDICLQALNVLSQMGYSEVNINMGCPSGIVVRKRKGSGMLMEPAALEHFLEDVFSALPGGMKLSVKTRIGLKSPEEFPALLDIFNRYPIHELILHPRVRTQFYQGDIHIDSFRYAMEHCSMPLIYNGEMHSPGDLNRLAEEFPNLPGVMLGRGLIKDPNLWGVYKNQFGNRNMDTFLSFHEDLLQGYSELLPYESSVVVKMKKLWACWKEVFPEDPEAIRTILQTNSLTTYREMCRRIFAEVNR